MGATKSCCPADRATALSYIKGVCIGSYPNRKFIDCRIIPAKPIRTNFKKKQTQTPPQGSCLLQVRRNVSQMTLCPLQSGCLSSPVGLCRRADPRAGDQGVCSPTAGMLLGARADARRIRRQRGIGSSRIDTRDHGGGQEILHIAIPAKQSGKNRKLSGNFRNQIAVLCITGLSARCLGC